MAELAEVLATDAREIGRRGERQIIGTGHPILFGFAPATAVGRFPDAGGYPKGFLKLAYQTLGVTDPTRVLHLCAGSVQIGVTVDIRPELNPDIVADVRHVPVADESFDWIMADPPYSAEWGQKLYGLKRRDYPAPAAIIREAARILRPGGRVGLLHFMVPGFKRREGLRMVGVWGVTTGTSTQIRAWTVLEKEQRAMFDVPADIEAEREKWRAYWRRRDQDRDTRKARRADRSQKPDA